MAQVNLCSQPWEGHDDLFSTPTLSSQLHCQNTNPPTLLQSLSYLSGCASGYSQFCEVGSYCENPQRGWPSPCASCGHGHCSVPAREQPWRTQLWAEPSQGRQLNKRNVSLELILNWVLVVSYLVTGSGALNKYLLNPELWYRRYSCHLQLWHPVWVLL